MEARRLTRWCCHRRASIEAVSDQTDWAFSSYSVWLEKYAGGKERVARSFPGPPLHAPFGGSSPWAVTAQEPVWCDLCAEAGTAVLRLSGSGVGQERLTERNPHALAD